MGGINHWRQKKEFQCNSYKLVLVSIDICRVSTFPVMHISGSDQCGLTGVQIELSVTMHPIILYRTSSNKPFKPLQPTCGNSLHVTKSQTWSKRLNNWRNSSLADLRTMWSRCWTCDTVCHWHTCAHSGALFVCDNTRFIDGAHFFFSDTTTSFFFSWPIGVIFGIATFCLSGQSAWHYSLWLC